jgi:ankyrin repeat protein
MDGFRKLVEVILEGDDILGVVQLVQEGVDVNYRLTSSGTTILHYCSGFGRTGVMGYLVRGLGADINARDINQMTPLHYALAEETTNIMRQSIIKETSKILPETHRGKIIEWNDNLEQRLCEHVEEMKKDLLDCLLNYGADINAKYDIDVTSLTKAIHLRSTQAVAVLAGLGLAKSNSLMTKSMTALLLATEQGQKEVMTHLVQNGADIHASCSTIPPLHQAVESGNVEIVQTLLENGADVNSVKYENITPVYHAVQKQPADMGVFTCLAHLGADFNAQCVITRVVHDAVAQESSEMLDCILRYVIVDAPRFDHIVKQQPIVGVSSSNCQLLEQLVKCGVDPNAKFDNAISTLIEASRTGNIEIVKKLVGHGFVMNVANISIGVTPFYSYLQQILAPPAKKSDIPNIIKSLKVLTDLGANVNATIDHLPVLHDAVTRGDVDMVFVLCHLGANMNAIGYRGLSILNEYMTENQIRSCDFDNDIMKFLVEAGADINAGYDAIPPLILAVERSDKEMVLALVTMGASMSKVMAKLATPLHQACALDTTYILECLLEHGANPNVEYVEGIEPLLEALRLCDIDMAEFLLQCGADPTVGKEYMRWNATRVAIDSGDGNVLKCLIKAGIDLNAEVSHSATEYLQEESIRIAEGLGISFPDDPFVPTTLLTGVIMRDGNIDIVETILDENSYPNLDRKPVVMYSDLQAACYFGYLDIVRLLIFDIFHSSNAESRDSLPFDILPLATYVNYHTLHQTRTTENAIEQVVPGVEYDFQPFVLCRNMESLLGTPGLGDVQCIHQPKSKDVHKEVHRAVCEITERFQIFPKVPINVRSCGSGGEGTKVGLPDEMDFLVEVGSAEQRNLESARHDYVYYSVPDNYILEEGSKTFHSNVFNKLRLFVKHRSTSNNGSVTVSSFLVSNMISDSKRKATTPMSMFWENQQSPISIDFVPSLHVDDWPESAIPNTWLLSRDELRKHGYYIVPKPPHVNSDLAEEYSSEDLKVLWKMSFPHLETYHMQNLEQRVKDAYVLAKCLRNPDVCRILVTDEGSLPRKVDKYVTSYMLKMIFFNNMEEFRRLDMTLGEMVCRVYEGVEEGLSKNGSIPLYFMQEVSALGGNKLNIPKCARVAKIMKKFVHALYLRDCQRDSTVSADVEEVVVYQRKPATVYRSFEIGEPGSQT